MKATIPKSAFANALKRTSRRGGDIAIAVTDGVVTLNTAHESGLTTTLEPAGAEGHADGHVRLELERVFAAAKRVKRGGALTIVAERDSADDPQVITLDAGAASVELLEEPTITRLPANIENGLTWQVSDARWAQLVALTGFTSGDDARPALCALAFGRDAVAATDSYKLGVVKADAPFTGLLPNGAVKALAAWKPTNIEIVGNRPNDDVKKVTGDSAHGFALKADTRQGAVTVTTPETPGSFPDWWMLMPNADDAVTTLTGDLDALADASARLSKIAGTTPGASPVVADVEDGSLVLQASAGYAGETLVTERVPSWDVEGPDENGFLVAFNGSYLAPVRDLMGPASSILIRDPLKPIHFLGDDPDVEALLMPMRI